MSMNAFWCWVMSCMLVWRLLAMLAGEIEAEPEVEVGEDIGVE